MLFPRTPRQERLVTLAAELADRFAARAAQHDRENSFPHDNVADLRDSGYAALTVPEMYGGTGADLLEFVLCEERLARGDGGTALAIGMSLSLIAQLSETHTWPLDRYAAFCRDVVREGATINSAASEAQTGSPSRGGKPTTTAHRSEGAWVIDGRKIFTTMSPALSYFVVSASLDGDPGDPATGNFLIPRSTPGLSVLETWDTLGMRSSGSNDLLLDHCQVPPDALITKGPGPGNGPLAATAGKAWGPMLISAVYTGIATAARDFAVTFARERVPSGLGKPIAELPSVQARIGEMEIRLVQSRRFLFSLAQDWVDRPEQRVELLPEVTACKYLTTNNAIAILDWAMRVVGGMALSRSLPLERYYRDVRAGLNHPPMDDVTMVTLAKAAIEQSAREGKRN